MAKQVISRDLLFSEKYSQIYTQNNWFENAKEKDLIFFQLNTSKFRIEDFYTKFPKFIKEEIEVNDSGLFILPLKYRKYVTEADYEFGFLLNPSSYIPPSLIQIEDNDKILDICAAPGVKTGEIMLKAIANNKNINIFAVEKDQKRYFKMVQLLENLFNKSENIKTVNLDSRFLKVSDLYDQILCDVPCSAEGEMIRKNDFSRWSSKIINSYTNTQKAILAKAITLVKPGGNIIYSTCTLAPEENEEIVSWAMERFDIQIEDVELPDFSRHSPTIVKGLEKWGKKEFPESIKKTIRIMPDKNFEGFYIAKLRKN